MAMEVRCGQCYGILLIETPGVIVACPHCGVHLSFPGSEEEVKPDPDLARRIESEIETPYPFKLPKGSTGTEPNVETAPIDPASNHPKELTTSAVTPAVVSPPVVTHPVVSQPVVSPPVVTHPVVTHPVVTHPVVTHPVVTHHPPASQPVVSHSIVTEPVVTQPVISQPTVPQPAVSQPAVVSTALPQSGPDFSWMSTAARSQAANVPPSVPLPGLDLTAASVTSEAQGFSPASVSTGDAKPVAAPPSSGYSFSTPDLSVESSPLKDSASGSAGSSAGTPQFDLSTHQMPGPSNDSTINDVIDPTVLRVPSATMSATAKDRGSCLPVLLLIIGSYASLITIYAIYLTLMGRTHQLESLPDLKTVQQQGGRAVVPRPENDLPKGHELKIGQSQRYGNIRVTPLRVTRGPIKFVHFTNDPDQKRDPSLDVLKLWLKFENVSAEQTITPIDPTLMYFQKGHSPVISYNVIFRQEDRKKQDGLFFYNYVRPVESEWQIVGQDANRALLPHENYETFIPSQEQIEDLTGDVIWRVHFRKGYGPQTGNGVTTLIDVRFNSNDVVSDPA